MSDEYSDAEKVAILHQRQLDEQQATIGAVRQAMSGVAKQLQSQSAILEEIESSLGALPECEFVSAPETAGTVAEIELTETEARAIEEKFESWFSQASLPNVQGNSWDEVRSAAEEYFSLPGTKRRSLEDLLSPQQKHEIIGQIESDFTIRKAQCDRLDYLLAAACGLLGGLIDVIFIGAPGEGALTKVTDDFTDKAVMKFAKICGWSGPRDGSDPVKSAIGFLERKFKVNYDQSHGGAVGPIIYKETPLSEPTIETINMSPKNHHLKNLAHSPDIIGLFFSVLDQFSNTAHFVSNGKIIWINTETFELSGNNFAAKIFCGFVNWFGHVMSDIAGSSGAHGRGSGLPMPFYELFQFINIGGFGQYRQTYATICVKVFEQGYDARHGMALSIPVLITELMTRLCWTLKQKFYHKKEWQECIPRGNNPELHRMLFVAYSSFCMVDGGAAALRSGGQIVAFLLNTNIIAWSRFSVLALNEARYLLKAGSQDNKAIDEYLDTEFTRLIIKA